MLFRSSLNNQNETSYLLGGKSSSIGPGSGESTIRPPTSTDSLHASSGLSGSSSSPSLLSSSNNQLGLGSTGILNDSAIEGEICVFNQECVLVTIGKIQQIT